MGALAINVCVNNLSYAAAGKQACLQLLHKLMGDAASAISFQGKRLVPVSDHSPTSIPIVVPIINPDNSSAEYMLTMKEAATLAYLWNVGMFPLESARPTVFELLFKSLRLEEASMHTQAMKDQQGPASRGNFRHDATSYHIEQKVLSASCRCLSCSVA